MEQEALKQLIDAAMSTGVGFYHSWRVDFADNSLWISHHGSPCAHFNIAGFEQGEMVYDSLCSDAECPILDSIDLYMQGALA